MKKILFSVIAVTMITTVKGQTPDMGFETWANVPLTITNVQDPQGWASLNILTTVFVGMTQTVFKETTTPYAGTTSAKVVTEVVPGSVAIPNPFDPGDNLDTVGVLALGKVSSSGGAPSISFGQPYASRPAALLFACKYTPMLGDSAGVRVFLTKWNGTSRDTIASGKYSTGITTTSYATQTINLTYNSSFNSITPDTQMIFISSSVYFHDGAKVGSAFYVDEMAWSGYTSTNDIDGIISNVSVFPNPSSEKINFESSVDATIIEITDITGRQCGVYKMTNNKTTITTETYLSGIYFYNMYNHKKRNHQ